MLPFANTAVAWLCFLLRMSKLLADTWSSSQPGNFWHVVHSRCLGRDILEYLGSQVRLYHSRFHFPTKFIRLIQHGNLRSPLERWCPFRHLSYLLFFRSLNFRHKPSYQCVRCSRNLPRHEGADFTSVSKDTLRCRHGLYRSSLAYDPTRGGIILLHWIANPAVVHSGIRYNLRESSIRSFCVSLNR